MLSIDKVSKSRCIDISFKSKYNILNRNFNCLNIKQLAKHPECLSAYIENGMVINNRICVYYKNADLEEYDMYNFSGFMILACHINNFEDLHQALSIKRIDELINIAISNGYDAVYCNNEVWQIYKEGK